MTEQGTNPVAPIDRDSPLGRALLADAPPPLSADFADRVLAGAKDRADPMPPLRPQPERRWRTARRAMIGLAAFGALGTAAAATGLLKDYGISLPEPVEQFFETITGQGDSETPARKSSAALPETPEPVSAPVPIVGPIDTPQELEEVFRRTEENRGARVEERRGRLDDRIDRVIERRRDQGMPAPTPEREAQLKERLQQFRERRDASTGEMREQWQENLREELERDGEVTREDIRQARPETEDSALRAERLEELRNLTPAERRARLRQWRQERRNRLQDLPAQPAEPADETAQDSDVSPAEPPPQVDEEGGL